MFFVQGARNDVLRDIPSVRTIGPDEYLAEFRTSSRTYGLRMSTDEALAWRDRLLRMFPVVPPVSGKEGSSGLPS